jgi:hypothetical protein
MAARGRSSADEKLIAELAAGRTVAEAATAAGVSERTVYRRLSDEGFALRVRQARSQFLDNALGVLSATSTAAAGVLKELLTHADANVKHRAAAEILKTAVKFREVLEVEERLRAIEQKLAAADKAGGDDQ